MRPGRRGEVGERRSKTAAEWRELRRGIRDESGLSANTPAWWALLIGLALGLELSRRLLGGDS